MNTFVRVGETFLLGYLPAPLCCSPLPKNGKLLLGLAKSQRVSHEFSKPNKVISLSTLDQIFAFKPSLLLSVATGPSSGGYSELRRRPCAIIFIPGITQRIFAFVPLEVFVTEAIEVNKTDVISFIFLQLYDLFWGLLFWPVLKTMQGRHR